MRHETRPTVETLFVRFSRLVKAKFHYASWFEAGRRQVRSGSVTSFEPASHQLRTSFQPDSVMEFGREPASSC